MRWRIRKKKGLLKDPVYEKIKERLFQELKEEAAFLERRAEQIRLPEEGASEGNSGGGREAFPATGILVTRESMMYGRDALWESQVV